MTVKAWRIAGAVLFFLTMATPSLAEQCVSFARRTSGIELRGDAWNWWQAAEGRYERGMRPQSGAVMVFKPTSKMKRGHVAVVRQVIDNRHIRIDHANWPRGRRTLNAAAVDISPANDWSEVKVTRDPSDLRWVRTNPVHGFIYAKPAHDNAETEILQAQAPVAPIRHYAVTIAGLPELPAPAPQPSPAPVRAVRDVAPVKVARDVTPPPAAVREVVQAAAPATSGAARNTAAHLNATILARLRGQSADKVLQANLPMAEAAGTAGARPSSI